MRRNYDIKRETRAVPFSPSLSQKAQFRRAGHTRRINPTSAIQTQSPSYAIDQLTTPLYAVPSTTTPNTMRYQANAVKSWWLM